MSVQILDWLRVAIKFLVWAVPIAVAVWLAGLVEAKAEISFIPAFLLCLFPVAALWFALARVRRAGAAMLAQWLIRTGITRLVYLGVWGLLLASQPQSAAEMAAGAGRDRLCSIYDAADAVRQSKIIAAVRWIEESQSAIAREAAVFLETVGY